MAILFIGIQISFPFVMRPAQHVLSGEILMALAIYHAQLPLVASKKTTTRNINVIMCDYLMISPNPSTNVTTISVEPSEEDIPDETTSWDLEVYDQSQALKAKKEKIMSRSTCLNTSGWKEGIYIVRALYNGEILTGKLVVKP
jgi:hypothetical protein